MLPKWAKFGIAFAIGVACYAGWEAFRHFNPEMHFAKDAYLESLDCGEGCAY